MKQKTCIILTGPTAVGKTDISLALAAYYNTSIISADSRQCYKELNIGVAKPSEEELQQVTHYFINSHSIQEDVTAAVFEKYALEAVETIFHEKDIALMVGGTGLYVKAFCEGLDAIPPVDPAIRQSIISGFETNGISWLQEQIREKDPLFSASGELQNPQRIMRALEVITATGHSIRYFQQKNKAVRNFRIVHVGITLPRELLYARINLRVDIMMERGLLKEVEGLLPNKQLNALQTVGYTELFDHLEGHLSLATAVDNIKKNTRHYAKRQETWFRKDPSIHPISFATVETVTSYLDSIL